MKLVTDSDIATDSLATDILTSQTTSLSVLPSVILPASTTATSSTKHTTYITVASSITSSFYSNLEQLTDSSSLGAAVTSTANIKNSAAVTNESASTTASLHVSSSSAPNHNPTKKNWKLVLLVPALMILPALLWVLESMIMYDVWNNMMEWHSWIVYTISFDWRPILRLCIVLQCSK